ncbi:MAG: hypothetical protein EBU66_20865 [Bacteroidetes bacterium]|nr:hypothetical protein [bacterium]NBP67084.1 hypothetical protein [Bacteroidota bacterium]
MNSSNITIDIEKGKSRIPKWHSKEEEFLKRLKNKCEHLAVQYMELYKVTHTKQSRLRLPAIIMSSFSGVASFGSTSFPLYMQKYVSIGVGIINITIAILQTYESYLKISDIVSKSLTASASLKKIADDIGCEMYIPVENRQTNGVTFLRDTYSRYQTILVDAPPLAIDDDEATAIFKKLQEQNLGEILDDDEDESNHNTVIKELQKIVNQPQKTL